MVFGARTTRFPGRCVLAALTLFLLCGMAMAQQETGQISGTVKDQSGAVVSGATIVVKNAATGLERSINTEATGLYTVTNLLPGTYSVTATMKGFNAAKKQLELYVGSKANVDFSLEVGTATTVIEVAGGAVEQVNVESQVLMDVVTNKQVDTLPTLTRNPYDLVAIGGNIAEDADSNRGAGYAINGQRSSSTNLLLDGSDNNDAFTATVGQSVPLDSVQEFSVVTSSFTAEYGRAGGGVINVATKSGSNMFHGSAYEFNRVSALSSNGFDNNAYEVPKSVFARNQFGYSVGGPVIKDKLFFFNNTEWFRIRSNATAIAYVPTPQLIGLSAPATQAFFNMYGTLKSGVADKGIVTKASMGCDETTPLCNALADSTPLWRKVSYPVPLDAGGGDPRNEYQTVARVDYNISPNTTLYGRYSLQSQDAFKGVNGDSPYAGFDTGYNNFNQNYLASLTHTFTPRLVSQTKVVYNRLNQLQPLAEQPGNSTLYMSSGATSIGGTNIALPGYLPFNPGSAIPFGGPQNLGQLYEDVSWVKGSHNFRFGGSYIYIRDNRAFGAYSYAVQQLGSDLTTGLEHLLAGTLTNFSVAAYPQGKFPCIGGVQTPDCTLNLPVSSPDFTRSNRYHDFGFYAQDTWKVKPRVTLNLGMRWEYYGVQHNKNPKMDSNFYLGAGSTMEEQIINGKVLTVPNSPYGGLWEKDLNNFAPRVGIAWDVFGNGKTSIRGGYGISYERNFGNVTFNVIQNPPNNATISMIPGDVPGGILPIYTDQMGPLAGSSGTKKLPRTSLRAVDEHMKNAYAHNWSIALEQELAKNTIFSLEYTGSKGVGLYGINRENMPGSYQVYNQTDVGFGYINPQYSVINYRTVGGFSRYHGMIASLKGSNLFNKGLQLQLNYTWGHSIDNLSSTFSDSLKHYNLGFLDPRNPELDKGDADFDIRHRVAISAIWDIPFAKNTNKVAKTFLDGWSLAPIFTARTGGPFDVYDCTTGYYFCNRIIMVNSGTSLSSSGTPKATGTNEFALIDLSAQDAGKGSYMNPYSGTADFGPYPANMAARNAFRRPGAYMVDLGIYKNFAVTETYKLQFRAEFYNLFNHANLDMTDNYVDFGSQDYVPGVRGVTVTSQERRNIQFALKFTF